MNRIKISYGIGCFYIVAMFCLYFFRFHRNDITGFIKKYTSGVKKVDEGEKVEEVKASKAKKEV